MTAIIIVLSSSCALIQVGRFPTSFQSLCRFLVSLVMRLDIVLPHLGSDCFRYDVCHIRITVVTLGKYRLLTEEHLEQELFSSFISSVSTNSVHDKEWTRGLKLTCIEVNISQKYRRVGAQKPMVQLLTFVAKLSYSAQLFAFNPGRGGWGD